MRRKKITEEDLIQKNNEEIERRKFVVSFIDSDIGYGVFAKTPVAKGELLLEYRGRLSPADTDAPDATYVYFFQHQKKEYCVDATNSKCIARFVNDIDCETKPNCRVKKVIVDGTPRLGVFALEDIAEGVELRYDYGCRDNPWRSIKKSKKSNPPAAVAPVLNPPAAVAPEPNTPVAPVPNTPIAPVPNTAAAVAPVLNPPAAVAPESNTPVSPVPNTPVAPEPNTPVAVAPEPNTPVAPVSNTPVAPEPNTPVAPVSNTPVAPVPNTPVAPEPNTPVAPEPNTPVAPEPNTPVAPVPNTPVAPVPNTPVAPVLNPPAAVAPVPNTPVAPVPNTPVAPVPYTPVAPEPNTPVAVAPVLNPPAAVAPEPNTPVAVAPEPNAPVAPVPNTPVAPESNTPVAPVPNTPVAPVSNTPVAPVPNTPVAPEPNTPVAPEPNTPVAPEPNTPVAVAPVLNPPAAVAPVPNTPVAPVPNTAVAPVPNTPVAPEPNTPVAPVPNTAVAPEPNTSAAPQPNTPVAPVPYTAVAPEPNTPVASEPNTAAAPVPYTAVAPEPNTPVAPVPYTAAAPVPYTAVAPEPNTPVAPEPNTPVAPVPYTAVAPVPYTAVAPEPNTPGAPVPYTAVAPEPNTQVDPVPYTAVAPVPNTPVAPVPYTPVAVAPEPNTPVAVAPEPNTPVAVAPEPNTPVAPEPNTPVAPEPNTPVAPVSNTPVAPVPNTPVAPVPYTPVAPVPYTPVAPEPNTPVAPVPNTPVAPVPYTPVAPEPNTPVAPVSNTPVAPVPYTPVAPVPYTAVAPVPYTAVAPVPYTAVAPEPNTQVDPVPVTSGSIEGKGKCVQRHSLWGAVTEVNGRTEIVYPMDSEVMSIGSAATDDIVVLTAARHETLLEVNHQEEIYLVNSSTQAVEPLSDNASFEVGGRAFKWKAFKAEQDPDNQGQSGTENAGQRLEEDQDAGTCQQGNGQVEFVVVRDECGFQLAAQCDQQQGADYTMNGFVPDSDSGAESDVVPYPALNSVLVTDADSTTSLQSEGKQKKKVFTVWAKEDHTKRHACVFCSKLDPKIARHLCKKHKNEKIIAQMPPVSKKGSELQKKREQILDALRNEGDFIHNIDILKYGKKGGIIVAKRPAEGTHNADDYLPCKFCLRFYIKSELWRHGGSCPFRQDVDKSSTCTSNEKESTRFIQSSKMLLFGAGVHLNLGETSASEKEEFYTYVLGALQNDSVGRNLKRDPGLVQYGKTEFERLGRRRANEVRYRMRLLERVKGEVKSLCDSSLESLESFLTPDKFPLFIQAVRAVVGISEDRSLNGVMMFDKPELAKKVGQMIRKFAEICEGRFVVNGNREARQSVKDFLFLYTTQWKSKIGSIAHQTSAEKKFNKKVALPLTEDVQKVQQHLDKEIVKLGNMLQKSPCAQTWQEFAKVILTKLTLFNFRRGNECAAMQVAKFQQRNDWKLDNQEIYQSLQSFEQELAQRMDLVEVMGKQNRKVPILLTPVMKAAIERLIKHRDMCGIDPRNIYVFAKGQKTFIEGSQALRCVLEQVVDLKRPDSLRYPTMRKYLATVVQVFGMPENELQEVARHMGHELSVHRKFYRLQDDVIELAKIAKLLLAVESGKAHQFNGVSLDDLDFNDIPEVGDDAKSVDDTAVTEEEESVDDTAVTEIPVEYDGYDCDTNQLTVQDSGLYCEVDIDECQVTDTCKNGASCTNTDGGYICNCTLGYQGQDCGTPNCDLVDCKNGATCSINNKQWSCVCPQYYEASVSGFQSARRRHSSDLHVPSRTYTETDAGRMSSLSNTDCDAAHVSNNGIQQPANGVHAADSRKRPARLKTKQRENQPNDQYNFDDSDQDPDYKDDSSDSDGEPVVKRKKTEKKKWTEEEKGVLTPLVLQAYREGKPPNKAAVNAIIQENPILKKLKWLSIKYMVWALAQQKLKARIETMK